jgi:hypothetical protein
VLVAGGFVVGGGIGSTGGATASSELYDPGTGTWAASGNMNEGRVYHMATLLLDGKVLVTAGRGADTLASAELYDPSTGTWTATGSMVIPRQQPTATLLSNGRVLVAGGFGATDVLASAELYNLGSGT